MICHLENSENMSTLLVQCQSSCPEEVHLHAGFGVRFWGFSCTVYIAKQTATMHGLHRWHMHVATPWAISSDQS